MTKMEEFWYIVKWIIAWCIRHILQAMFFLPVRKNRILFSSFSGLQYSCNPKYISEYLIKHGGENIDIIWEFTQPKKYAHIPWIRRVRHFSPLWLYYVATAAVVVTNMGFSQLQPKRKGQLLINTWHGGGAYKRVGTGMVYAMSRTKCRALQENLRKTDLFISSSRAFTNFAIVQDFNFRGEVLPSGMPRNDLFFDKEKRIAAAHKVRAMLGTTGFIAVYAPTFRGKKSKGYCTDHHFPYQSVLSVLRQRFGEEAVILKRAHPGGKMIDEAGKDVLDVTDYPDMQELLCAADMLITDYSSSIWDYALLGRPCLLYVPDLEDYKLNRGLCTPVEEWPGIVCKDEEQLLNAVLSFDEKKCAQKAAEHLRALGSYETGTATQRICERILQHIERGK